MKYDYCKNCFYFRRFIMLLDLKKDNGVPLYNKSKNGNTNINGNSHTREMIFNCDKYCMRIENIKYCMNPSKDYYKNKERKIK